MLFPSQLQSYTIGDTQLEIYAPEMKAVQEWYCNNRADAYWAQVWPASIGLCLFLQQYPKYISGKNVLELAAGLGLTGLYASSLAKQVCITDREAQASFFVNQSAAHLHLENVKATAMDWKAVLQLQPLPEVVILSDVNYEPAIFDELWQVIQFLIKNNIVVVISTPQRLVAKDFLNRLLADCAFRWDSSVTLHNKKVEVTVFVIESTR